MTVGTLDWPEVLMPLLRREDLDPALVRRR